MKLSDDQNKALEKLLAWHRDPRREAFVTLGGYAGTGKTTLISFFKKEISGSGRKIKIGFCSYTGRAAQNLKNKLREAGALCAGDSVSTIHGLIYIPQEDRAGQIAGWRRREDLERDLIIVDEASMVDGPVWRDLLSYNIPIVAVGDHGQLPPVSGEFNLMERPEIMLTEIHRQAKGNPIIKVSQHARKTGRVPVKEYGEGVVKFLRENSDAQEKSAQLLEAYRPDTLILCGYNSTRTKINQFVRSALGFEGAAPGRGDRVICLRNNGKKNLCNGMLGTILDLEPAAGDWRGAEIKMDDAEKPYSGLIYAKQFGAQKASDFAGGRRPAGAGDFFDFGYAQTVHKAQGGQAKKVIMFEERFAQMDDEAWRRWLYTGVTRAEEELYLFGD